MGVERLADKDLQLPGTHPKTKGPEWPVEGPEDFNCLHCKTIWEPDEQASMMIQTRSTAAIGEIIIVCPKCGAKSVLCPDAASPEKGHFIRQLDEAAMSKEEWREQWRREAEEDRKHEEMNPTSGTKNERIRPQDRPSCNGQVPRQKYGGAKTK